MKKSTLLSFSLLASIFTLLSFMPKSGNAQSFTTMEGFRFSVPLIAADSAQNTVGYYAGALPPGNYDWLNVFNNFGAGGIYPVVAEVVIQTSTNAVTQLNLVGGTCTISALTPGIATGGMYSWDGTVTQTVGGVPVTQHLHLEFMITLFPVANAAIYIY